MAKKPKVLEPVRRVAKMPEPIVGTLADVAEAAAESGAPIEIRVVGSDGGVLEVIPMFADEAPSPVEILEALVADLADIEAAAEAPVEPAPVPDLAVAPEAATHPVVRWSRTDSQSTCPAGTVSRIRDDLWAVTIGDRDCGTVTSRDKGERRVVGW